MSGKWISARDAAAAMWPGENPVPAPINSVVKGAKGGVLATFAASLVKDGVRGKTKMPGGPIPVEFWDGVTVPDWQAGVFTANVRHAGSIEEWTAFGVMFDRAAIEAMAPPPVPAENAPQPAPQESAATTSQRKSGGALKKHDWEGALIAVVVAANTPDGLPDGYGAQTRIVKIMAEWFQKNDQPEPATSELKRRAQRIQNELELAKALAGTP